MRYMEAGFGEDKPLPTTSWLPTCHAPSYPVGVLLVLAMPVKNYPGNLASYSPNSWWMDRLFVQVPFPSYNALNN